MCVRACVRASAPAYKINVRALNPLPRGDPGRNVKMIVAENGEQSTEHFPYTFDANRFDYRNDNARRTET